MYVIYFFYYYFHYEENKLHLFVNIFFVIWSGTFILKYRWLYQAGQLVFSVPVSNPAASTNVMHVCACGCLW